MLTLFTNYLWILLLSDTIIFIILFMLVDGNSNWCYQDFLLFILILPTDPENHKI